MTQVHMCAGMYTETVAALTSCWNEISIWDEEFVAVMFLQDVGEDLQGEALLLSGLLTPLVRVHFGVGQVRIVVFVCCIQKQGVDYEKGVLNTVTSSSEITIFQDSSRHSRRRVITNSRERCGDLNITPLFD